MRAVPWVAVATLLGLMALSCSAQDSGLDPDQRRNGSAAVDSQASGNDEQELAKAGLRKFVGAARCVGCHPAEAERWRGSDHDRAMEPASASSVLGDFGGRTLDALGAQWHFRTSGERYVIDISESGAETETLEVTSTLGVDPLQQYLVAGARGRQQVLPLAWDSRPEESGGQRWFSMHPGEEISLEDPLHWKGIAYNWNSQCAACHSTGVDKGYDGLADTFDTQSAEADVACEACHGPGSDHVARIANEQSRENPESSAAERTAYSGDFDVRFDAHDPERWQRPSSARIAHRVGELDPGHGGQAFDVCAPCHARRSAVVKQPAVGAAFLDAYMPSLLDQGLYFDDGQIREEVYVWGSFQQSRMSQAGVVCSDCHDPHSLSLRREGNALCAGCHSSEVFDAPIHRGHADAEPGPDCVDCHMPERIFMQVDPRRDHAFSIPRPARSAALGAPSACSTCHSGQDASWAENAVAAWRGGRPALLRWPDRLVGDGNGDVRRDATRWLEIALDDSVAPIVRGSAWSRYASEGARPPAVSLLRERLKAAEPLEKLGLIRLIEGLAPTERLSLLRPALSAEHRSIRIAAASALSTLPPNVGRPADRSLLARGLREYRVAQEANGERAEAQVNLGVLARQSGEWDRARAALLRATRLAPYFIPAYVEWAELARVEGREGEAIELLEKALSFDPRAAWVRYSLGLAYYRSGDLPRAVEALGQASKDDPEAPRLRLGWALALDAAGKRVQAIDVLTESIDRGVVDGEVWQAVVTLLRDEGRREEALGQARAWLAADPADARARALVESLRGPA